MELSFEIVFSFGFLVGLGTSSPFFQFGICLQYFCLGLILLGLTFFSRLEGCQQFLLNTWAFLSYGFALPTLLALALFL